MTSIFLFLSTKLHIITISPLLCVLSRRKRDDTMKININRTLAVTEWENDTLEMTKVSRVDIGGFLCIASVSIMSST
jgi:hypothetical protein